MASRRLFASDATLLDRIATCNISSFLHFSQTNDPSLSASGRRRLATTANRAADRASPKRVLFPRPVGCGKLARSRSEVGSVIRIDAPVRSDAFYQAVDAPRSASMRGATATVAED
jgi:hypothetical protein